MERIPSIDIGDAQQRLCGESVLAAAHGIRGDLSVLGVDLDADMRRTLLERLQTLFWTASRETAVEIGAQLVESGVRVRTTLD